MNLAASRLGSDAVLFVADLLAVRIALAALIVQTVAAFHVVRPVAAVFLVLPALAALVAQALQSICRIALGWLVAWRQALVRLDVKRCFL